MNNDPMPRTAEERARPWRPGEPVRLETARTIIRSMTAEDVTDRDIGWFADAAPTASPTEPGDTVGKGIPHFHSPAKLVCTIHESHEGKQEVLAGRRDRDAGGGGGGGLGVAGGGRVGGGAEAGPAHPLHPG